MKVVYPIPTDRTLDGFALARCVGKHRHETHGEALRAMLTTPRIDKGPQRLVRRVYHCSFCAGFHWGHGRG